MKAALEKLSKAGAELYAEAQAAARPPGRGGAPARPPQPEAAGQKAEKKADVVDADFEVVDDDKGKK